MKKVILIIIVLTIGVNSFSQESYLNVTIGGLEFQKNPTQDYIVVDFEGKTQAELYKSFLSEITTLYTSAKDIVSKVENQTISINARSFDAINVKVGRNPVVKYDINYNLVFLFKDDKVRINLPIINNMQRGANNLIISGDTSFLSNNVGVYRKGVLKIPSAKESIEDFFNVLINEVVLPIQSNQNSNW